MNEPIEDIEDETLEEDDAPAPPRRLTWAEQEELERRAEEAERERFRQKRKEFRQKLFGTDDPVALLAPQALEDYDDLLGEHAAQLRNAVRYAMEDAVSDSIRIEQRLPALAVLARLVQTNLAIAKAMKKNPQNSTL
jgi:hypothetical protein